MVAQGRAITAAFGHSEVAAVGPGVGVGMARHGGVGRRRVRGGWLNVALTAFLVLSIVGPVVSKTVRDGRYWGCWAGPTGSTV